MRLVRHICVWAGLLLATLVPLGFAASSPLLQWRDEIYITAGLAGVFALVLLLYQLLLGAAWLPMISTLGSRRAHRWVGCALLGAVILHIVGLWVTSPPDVIDALLFVSPTPFSVWGVIAMWGLFLTVTLAIFRGKLRIAIKLWRWIHVSLAIVIVAATVAHTMLIQGTMEAWSKGIVCLLLVCVAARVLMKRAWR